MSRFFLVFFRRVRKVLKYGYRLARVVFPQQNVAAPALPESRYSNPFWEKPTPEYDLWVQQNELAKRDYAAMQKRSAGFFSTPRISIILDAGGSEFSKTIESVLNQVYQNWELCVLCEEPALSSIQEVIRKQKKMHQMRFFTYTDKEHQTQCHRKALQAASGEFIIFIDEGDTLVPEALYEVVKMLNEHPRADFIYSDEDKVFSDGRRFAPSFKPDWSPETLLSSMYTGQLAVYRKSLLLKTGGPDAVYGAAQMYDLVLRYTEQTSSDRIHHIPRVLYHRLAVSERPSVNRTDHENTKKVLQRALQRRNIDGEVLDGLAPSLFRVKRRIKGEPKIAIIIPTYNRADLLRTCITSIEKTAGYQNYEIVVVDNRSDDPQTLQYLRELAGTHTVLRYPQPFNFSAINNFAVAQTKSEHILFLNNDTEALNEGWLAAMLEYSQMPEIGAVGARLYYPHGAIQHAGVLLGVGGVAGHSHKYFEKHERGYMDRIVLSQNLSAVTAACLMVKRTVFEEVDGFNEKDLAVAFNDVDFCLKIMEKGYRNVYTPFAELIHYESISRGVEDSPKKAARFRREVGYMQTRWAGSIGGSDAFYSPNLTLVDENFGLRLS